MASGYRAHVALLVVQILFGSFPVMGRVVLEALPAPFLAALRIISAGFILQLIVRTWKIPRIQGRRAMLRLTACALFGVVLNQLLFLEGLSRSTAVNASILMTSIPVFTAGLSIALGYEGMSRRKALGILVSLLGAWLMLGVGGFSLESGHVVGNLMILCNALCYSIYLILARPLVQRFPSMSVIAGIFTFGSLFMLPIGILAARPLNFERIPATIWMVVAAIILFPTVLTYVLNAWALARLPPSVVSVYIYLQPVIGVILGVLLLHEALSMDTFIAAAMIFVGVFLVSRARNTGTLESPAGGCTSWRG